MKVVSFSSDGNIIGYGIQADSTRVETRDKCIELVGEYHLVATDPPYGNIVTEHWDRVGTDPNQFTSWMIEWTKLWAQPLQVGSAFYVWGGVGTPKFRPFYKYLVRVEEETILTLSNHITWAKKRGYGVQNNYLFAREELAYFVIGNHKKPRVFNVPYLETKRGYAGYNEDYPAKSEYYRRTTVWNDVTEILRDKRHVAQKAQRVVEIPIEVSTNPGEWVVDLFAGSFTTADAAIQHNRKFVCIESDEKTFDESVKRLASRFNVVEV